ncbi:MAG: hypothetical protein ACTSYL_08620 [Candidatus Thorarchaeota archaeon]
MPPKTLRTFDSPTRLILLTSLRFYDGWSAGRGFDGITVAVLGRNNPWGVFASAIFFGLLKAGGGNMQTFAGVPSEMVNVIQGLVVLFVAAPKLVDWLAKHGSRNAIRLKESPRQGIPTIAGIGYGVMTVIVAVAFVGSAGTNSLTLLILIMTMLAGLFTTVYLFKDDEFGIWSLIITSIVWLAVAVSYLGTFQGTLGTTTALIGGAGVLLFLWLLKLSERVLNKGVEEE